MKGCELWKLGIRNVFSAPVRSCLTVLGMAIGIAAILAVLTLGSAGQEQVQSEMNRLGIDKVWVTTSYEPICYGAGERLAANLNVAAAEQVYLPVQIYTETAADEIVAIGCTEAYLRQIGAYVTEGRMLYPLEWDEQGRSVLIGEKVAEMYELKAGETVQIANQLMTIAGIIGTSGGASRVQNDQAVYVPLQTLLPMTNHTIHEVMLSIPENMEPQRLAELAQHMISMQQSIDVDVTTMQLQIDAANSVIQTFVEVLKWVAMICMLVGGIGVMNILLVGVRERRREIGVMQALGTSRREISLLFLLEAMMYALIGGILGIVLGFGLIDAAARSIVLTPVIRLKDCIAVLLAAVLTGLFFGSAPAFKASGLNPVEALRKE